ncbi:MAG: TIGR00266 family protein [Planctomycetia bacterium TMED53]|nr:MAG: TIGR00266 family protein [Planctomycetia bacterium TMED53]
MKFNILETGAFQSALVEFGHGEEFFSESGAMVRASGNVDMDVTTRSRGKSGIMGGIKRLFSGESFFLSTYTVGPGETGEVGLAPVLPGEMKTLSLDGSTTWVCSGGSFIAAGGDNVELETKFQGLGSVFSGEGMFFLEVSGVGDALVGGFGALHELEVDGELTLDTGHLIAYEKNLDYTITKAASSWTQSFFSGEGFVMKFEGSGKVIAQTHDASGFGSTLGPLLPERSS